jgi:hypothetical protein
VRSARAAAAAGCIAVSRYVEIELAQGGLDEVLVGLRALGIAFEHTGEALLLRGGIECAGQPADVRVPAGTLDAVEDFGFVQDAHGRAILVCGEPDRSLLRARLLAPLQLELARRRLAAEPSLAIEELVREADGSVRLTLRPRR